MATVALACAVTSGGLSLMLAANMSRLRNKARRVAPGDAEAEKRFLAGPEFQQARAREHAARPPRAWFVRDC